MHEVANNGQTGHAIAMRSAYEYKTTSLLGLFPTDTQTFQSGRLTLTLSGGRSKPLPCRPRPLHPSLFTSSRHMCSMRRVVFELNMAATSRSYRQWSIHDFWRVTAV